MRSVVVRTGFLSFAVALALLAPSTAQAAGYKCKRTATVKSGDLLRFTDFQEPGTVFDGVTIRRGAHTRSVMNDTIVDDAYFQATSKVVLDYGGNTYTIADDTIFMLACYGRTLKTGMTLPSLDMLTGEMKVRTGAKTPGGITTAEGLFDPRVDHTMTFEARRTLHRDGDDPTPDQLRGWYLSSSTAPFGRTEVRTGGKPIVGVTPTVGPNRFSCRYVHGATLTSKGRSKGLLTGSATYRD